MGGSISLSDLEKLEKPLFSMDLDNSSFDGLLSCLVSRNFERAATPTDCSYGLVKHILCSTFKQYAFYARLDFLQRKLLQEGPIMFPQCGKEQTKKAKKCGRS